ncbi:MAG: SIMPL domain-containing protein [Candidatus Paceibacterota bacterium]
MNIPSKFWSAAMGALGILTIFLVAAAIKEFKSIGYVGASENMVNSINVNGTGEAVSIPDIATFSFSVTETAKTVLEAQTKATEKTNAALKAVKDGGVEDKDVKTQNYSINPHYEYQSSVCTQYSCPSSKSILTGYDVSQSIEVKVRDLSKAGALFSAIGALGVQNVNGLSFSIDKPEALRAEARAKAIADAQSKAKELSKQLGVRLVRIISFSESGDERLFAYGKGGAMDMAVSSVAPAPTVPVGENKIVANVNISYEIR